MKKRNIICLLLAVLMLLACTACGGKTSTGDTAGTRTITDSKNRTVTIPDKVERGVCVGVGARRYSCYVGASDRVVGVEDYETKDGMSRLYNYVNFDKFKDLPVTGTNGEPYVEQIIDVAPQVIVMSAYASCDADELSGKTGIPVFVVPGSDTTLDESSPSGRRSRVVTRRARHPQHRHEVFGREVLGEDTGGVRILDEFRPQGR